MTPRRMNAVVTTGYGGPERLSYRDVPVPSVGPDDVLVRVRAAGVNNTDLNLRLGWYGAGGGGGTPADRDPGEASPGTADDVAAGRGEATASEQGTGEAGWNRPPPFPLIQGADACGIVAEVGDRVDPGLLGRRVLVRPCVRERGFEALDTVWMGSDFDGAFAEYVRVRASEAFPVACDWSDEALAAVPCAYGTAENMVERAGVTRGERVLVTGASGGVGSATVQLAKRRGATVVAVTSAEKRARVARLGADEVLERDAVPGALAAAPVDVIVDNVAGEGFAGRARMLRRGGRLVTSGAVAGARVGLDLRDLYLRDLTLLGTTAWAEPVFGNLIGYIERDEIRPVVEATFALRDIAEAQRTLAERRHVGKLVLLPDAASP